MVGSPIEDRSLDRLYVDIEDVCDLLLAEKLLVILAGASVE